MQERGTIKLGEMVHALDHLDGLVVQFRQGRQANRTGMGGVGLVPGPEEVGIAHIVPKLDKMQSVWMPLDRRHVVVRQPLRLLRFV